MRPWTVGFLAQRVESWVCACPLGGRAPVQYLATRQWLVHYAERGAEWSPMREEAYLPAGRKSFHYVQYYFEVTAGQWGREVRQSPCGITANIEP